MGLNAVGYRWTAGIHVAAVGLLMLFAGEIPAASNSDWETEKIQLDAACEAARATRLNSQIPKYIDECVEKQQRPDRESCERFYADYGSNPPLIETQP